MDERVIFHIDVNSAFLSWSALKRLEEDPGSLDLRTVPAAVGGDVRTRHGIITAKSIPAAKRGVKTGEPVVKALQKCPELILIPSDFATYRKNSRAFIDILRGYSPVLEQVSIDEAYLDITEALAARLGGEVGEELSRKMALALAHRIKDEIRERLGFTVNVGISTNKLLAKTASDFEKPDRVHTLYPEEVPDKLWPLGIGELHGCGGATSARLMGVGIRTVGEAAHASRSYLQSLLGSKAGDYIWHSANGRSDSPVQPASAEAKSYSNELTTSEDITAENFDKALTMLDHLCEKVASRLQKDQVKAFTIGVMVKTSRFRRRSRQMTLPDSTNDAALIRRTAGHLLEELLFGEDGLFAAGLGIRLIGVSAAGIDAGAFRQMDLFSWAKESETRQKQKERRKADREKAERLDAMLQSVEQRYGRDKLSRGMGKKKEGKESP